MHAHYITHLHTPTHARAYRQLLVINSVCSSQSSIEGLLVKVDSRVFEIQSWNLILHPFMAYVFANVTIEVIFVSALHTHTHTYTHVRTHAYTHAVSSAEIY